VLSILIMVNIGLILFTAWKTAGLVSRLVIYGSISLIAFSLLAEVLASSQDYYGPDAIHHPLFFVLIGFIVELMFFSSALIIVTRREQLKITHVASISDDLSDLSESDSKRVLAISTAQVIQYVNVSDIIRCEAQGAYSRFVIRDGREVLVSQPLKTQEELLSKEQFFRCHQSHLINLGEVRAFLRSDQSIAMSDGTNVPLSRSKRDHFIKAMELL